MVYDLIDLFAGCGGMTSGFVATGRFSPIAAVEADSDAAATYGANFGTDHVRNVRIEDVSDLPAASVVVGGPPCQGFSPLNKARDSALSRRLWREYARVLELVSPSVFVMENVPELLAADEYAAFRGRVVELGYTVEAQVLNAADYGVPQRRKRAIVIGSRCGRIVWPDQTHADPKLKSDFPRWVTLRDVIGDLPPKPDGVAWHRSRNSKPHIVERYSYVPKDGGNRFQMEAALDEAGLPHLVPPCWRRKRTGTYDAGGRLWWDRPATTIRCEFYKPEKGRYLHPEQDRAITVREAARLMSFDDEFVLPEDQTLTAIGRQVGNAVPPGLAHAVAEAIAATLDAAIEAEGHEAAA